MAKGYNDVGLSVQLPPSWIFRRTVLRGKMEVTYGDLPLRKTETLDDGKKKKVAVSKETSKLPWPSTPVERCTMLEIPSPSLSSLKFLRQMRSEWHSTTCSSIPAKSQCACGAKAYKKTLTELPVGNGSTRKQKKQGKNTSSLRASGPFALAWVKA